MHRRPCLARCQRLEGSARRLTLCDPIADRPAAPARPRPALRLLHRRRQPEVAQPRPLLIRRLKHIHAPVVAGWGAGLRPGVTVLHGFQEEIQHGVVQGQRVGALFGRQRVGVDLVEQILGDGVVVQVDGEGDGEALRRRAVV